ncbi:hypothetical protein RZN22_03215 [Bacillaceae bacterium S4-13-58]
MTIHLFSFAISVKRQQKSLPDYGIKVPTHPEDKGFDCKQKYMLQNFL